jgi:hypothetical protein
MIKLKLNDKADKWYVNIRWQLHKFVNYGPIAKLICSLIIWSVAAIPVVIYLFFRWLLNPITFWENLALFVAWILLFGWVQAIFLIFAIILTIHLVLEDW